MGRKEKEKNYQAWDWLGIHHIHDLIWSCKMYMLPPFILMRKLSARENKCLMPEITQLVTDSIQQVHSTIGSSLSFTPHSRGPTWEHPPLRPVPALRRVKTNSFPRSVFSNVNPPEVRDPCISRRWIEAVGLIGFAL